MFDSVKESLAVRVSDALSEFVSVPDGETSSVTKKVSESVTEPERTFDSVVLSVCIVVGECESVAVWVSDAL